MLPIDSKTLSRSISLQDPLHWWDMDRMGLLCFLNDYRIYVDENNARSRDFGWLPLGMNDYFVLWRERVISEGERDGP